MRGPASVRSGSADGHGVNQVQERPWRLYVIGALLGAFAFVVVGKLAYIQVLQHGYYRTLASEEHWRASEIAPPRGALLAADGAPLAVSVGFETVYADASRLGDKAAVASKLAPVLGETEEAIAARLEEGGERPVVLRRHLPAETADRVKGLRLLNVYLEVEPLRLHPEGGLASQLIGFVGADHKGLAGLERSLEKTIGGLPGSLQREVDAAESEIALGLREYRPPVRGADVVTTIDRFAQMLIERELDAAMERHAADAGTIVVLEPRTGAVLAMASRPSFRLDDPDLFEAGKESLYRCPAVSDLYEPGSVFKVVTMAAGLDAGAIAPDEVYYDAGYYADGEVVIRNWDGQGRGWQTMAQILQRSLNTGSSYIAKKLGPARFYEYVRAFGFGEPTGIDLPGEASGLVRTNAGSGWSGSDLLTNSFGQGIGVTPLQMARAVAAVANEGRLMKPQLVREVRSPTATRQVEPEVVRQVVRPETARTVTAMMVNAVEESVVGLAKVDGYRVAGKSGTAEMLVDGRYSRDDTVASFVGFAPAEDPRFLVLVAITRPKDNIWGEAVAAPIFSTIMRELLSHAGIGPTLVAAR